LLSKSNKKTRSGYNPNGDDRKKVNRSDRRMVRTYLAEGKYDSVPSEQKIKRATNSENFTN